MPDYSDIMAEERPRSKRHPMEIAHRAKQFAPFAALKGYEESLEKEEESFLTRCMAGEIGGRSKSEEGMQDRVENEVWEDDWEERWEKSIADFEVGF